MVLLSGLFEKWQFEPQLGARGAPLARIRSNQFPRLPAVARPSSDPTRQMQGCLLTSGQGKLSTDEQ